MSEQRFADLETRLAYQEHTIDQLDQALAAQQQRLEVLESLCEELARRVRELTDPVGQSSAVDERPPHY
jgi:SlyX protein